MDKGSSAGLHGSLVDIEGTPQFGAMVLFWSEATGISNLDNTGQGDADLGDSLALIENGTLLLKANVQRKLFPFPATLKNSSGTVTFTYDRAAGGKAAIQMTASFRVDKVDFKYNDKDDTEWELTIGCVRLGALTPSGFANNGAQPTTSARTPGNKYLYLDRNKTYDPATVGPIVDSSLMKLNVWGISADTDAAEVNAIIAILAAYNTPPQSREKVYTASVHRYSSSVVQITLDWKQLNSQDAIQVPGHRVRVDPWAIEDVIGSAVVFALSAIPAFATPPAGFKNRGETDTGLNKFLSVRQRDFSRNDSRTSIEIPGTSRHVDPNDLTSYTVSALYFQLSGGIPTPSAITGFKLSEYGNTGVNPFVSVQRRKYEKTDSKDKVELPGTYLNTDPYDLRTTGRKTLVASNSTTAYTPATGLQVVSSVRRQLTAAGTIEWSNVFSIGKVNSKEAITQPLTYTDVDPGSLNGYSSIAAIDATPSVQAGFKVRSTRSIQITPDHSVTIVRGGLRSTTDDEVFSSTMSFRSAQSPYLDSAVAVVAASGTVAVQANTLWAAFQSVAFALSLTVIPRTDGQRKVIYRYRNPGIQVIGAGGGGGRWVMSRMNGTNPQMYVVSNIRQGSGRAIQLGAQWVVNSDIQDFRIIRLITGTTLPLQNPSTINGVTMPYIGEVNNNTFLGLAAGTVVYKNPRYSTNISLSGTLPFWMTYDMHSDSQGIVQGLSDIFFRQPQYLPIASTSVGWVNVSTLGLSDVVSPNQSSFSAFTS